MFVIRMQYISKRHNNTRPRWFADREQLPFLSVFRPSICWLANHFFWKFKRINFIFLFAAQYFFTLRSKKDNEEFEDTRWFCLHCCEKETNTISNWKIHFAIWTNIFFFYFLKLVCGFAVCTALRKRSNLLQACTCTSQLELVLTENN